MSSNKGAYVHMIEGSLGFRIFQTIISPLMLYYLFNIPITFQGILYASIGLLIAGITLLGIIRREKWGLWMAIFVSLADLVIIFIFLPVDLSKGMPMAVILDGLTIFFSIFILSKIRK